MRIFFLTLNWNKADCLKKLYQSLLPAVTDLDWVWMIRDHNSADNSIQEIESWNDSHIRLIKYPHNKENYSQGMNFLFQEAKPNNDDLVMTLNNDVIFQDDISIKNMITLIQEDKEIGLVGAKLNYTNSTNIQHCGVLFHPSNGLPFHYRASFKEEERDKKNRYYPAVTGAVSLTTADIFKNIMYDPKFHWCFEDIAFALQVKQNLKKEIVYCGETNIWHEESSSLKKNPINKLFQGHNSQRFIDLFHKYIDISLPRKYKDLEFNLYKRNM